MIDLLAGALTGGGISHPDIHGAGNNMLSIYIDPQHGVGRAAFETWAAQLGDWVRSSALLDPLSLSTVMAPGDREAALTRERLLQGIPLDHETCGQLAQAAHQLGVHFPAPLRKAIA